LAHARTLVSREPLSLQRIGRSCVESVSSGRGGSPQGPRKLVARGDVELLAGVGEVGAAIKGLSKKVDRLQRTVAALRRQAAR
jgi:hypothetical protein